MFSDPIADMLTRIRNASRAKKAEVVAPYSKLKESLAHLLMSEGYVSGVNVVGNTKKLLTVTLRYNQTQPVITNLKRISKPGQRMYMSADKLPRTMSGFGITVISTSKGLMTDKQARKDHLGGEVICQVW
jgi:small subunit ribosomal protein S8